MFLRFSKNWVLYRRLSRNIIYVLLLLLLLYIFLNVKHVNLTPLFGTKNLTLTLFSNSLNLYVSLSYDVMVFKADFINKYSIQEVEDSSYKTTHILRSF